MWLGHRLSHNAKLLGKNSCFIETKYMHSVPHCSLIPRSFGMVFKWSGNEVGLIQTTRSRKLMLAHKYIYTRFLARSASG